jgi:4a-hydroxytetrahydrobiopterin dehydratase
VEKLSPDEIERALAKTTGWRRDGAVITKQFTFADFKAALAFVNKVGEIAETAAHHPDITINYNRVTLTLSTHDAGGLTERDFALAAEIETVAI